jgi:anti-sigma factor RsiW
MTDITCTYAGDREQSLIAYLYDDIDPAERASFAAHLPGCERCRRDLAALGGIRQQLSTWAPPEPQFSRQLTVNSRQTDHDIHPPSAVSQQRSVWWREIPAWAQVAAALLFLGVSAGIANLDIRYDANGFAVRTGWSKPASAPQSAAAPQPATVAPTVTPANYIDRDQLAALERTLRAEIHAAQPARANVSDADVLRRVRALIDDSEKRQQRELALRVAQVIRDVTAQRQADLSKIDRNLGLIQNTTGVEILKQREMVNYLMRVSQRQ